MHPIDRREVHVDDEALECLQAAVREWFSSQAKGEQGEVTYYEDEGDDIFLVRHGTYYRAFPHWQGQGIDVIPLRLAVEDVMIYERESGLLRIKATQPKDRMEYLRLFTSLIVGEPKLMQTAAEAEVFSLAPVQDGSFDFNGDGEIRRVELRSVRLQLYGLTNPVIEIRSKDVLAAFRYDLGSLSLEDGVLLSAKFRFTIQRGSATPEHRTFEISPPSHSSLPDRRDTELILSYLQQQGVKLR